MTAQAARVHTARDTLERLFGIDVRSLALFRVGLALALLADLAWRSVDLKAFYTDFGVLPRVALIETFGATMGLPSLHLVSGSAAGQAVLFAIAAAFALQLLVGYRTRWAAAASWLLLISLHNRNPLVLHGGDTVLRMLAFWSLFLPLGACWSVDRALDSGNTRVPTRILSAGTTALLLQMGMVYWFAALLKSDASWRSEGTAVYYALSIPQFTLPFGSFLRGFPVLTRLLTFATILLEAFGPFLAFLPWRNGAIRTATVATFIAFHLGLGACLALGLFPLICAVGWTAFLPSSFWEAARRHLVARNTDAIRIYFDGNCAFCHRMAALAKTFLALPPQSIAPTQSTHAIDADQGWERSWVVVDAAGARHYGFAGFAPLLGSVRPLRPLAFFASRPPVSTLGDRLYRLIEERGTSREGVFIALDERPLSVRPTALGQALATLFLLYVIAWNVRTTDFPRFEKFFPIGANRLADLTRVDQAWDMFAPFPLRAGGWLVIPGKLQDGTEVDQYSGDSPVRWDRPESIVGTFPSDRWRKYLVNLRYPEYTGQLVYYGSYLCRRWNRTHTGQKQLDTFSIYYMEEVVLPDYRTQPVQKRLLWQHYCLCSPDQPNCGR